MGWIVYDKTDGELLRYYDRESKAKAQVTGHNRKAIMDALRGYSRTTEWDFCEWSDYEKIFAEYYTKNKWHMLQRSFY